MDKVIYKELKTATVNVDNSVDSAKVYDISADIRLQGQTTVESFENGIVTKDEMQIATFSCWSSQNVNINFNGVDGDEQCTVIEAINTFMDDVKAKASDNTSGQLPIEPTAAELVTQQLTLSRMMINTMSLTDEQALEVKDLYPLWEELIGQEVDIDFKFIHDEKLYKVLQKHTLQEDWVPGIETAALYTVISADVNKEHAGTKEDPIPYVLNMILEKDKYYILDGVLYICILSTLTGFPNDLRDLVSIVQKVEE